MSEDLKTLKLQSPIKIGDKHYDTLHLQESNAGMILDARQEAERAVMTPDGYQLLVSDGAMVVGIMRRQVARLTSQDGAELSGPIEIPMLHRLSSPDFRRLERKTEHLEAVNFSALEKELGARGRDEGASGERSGG